MPIPDQWGRLQVLLCPIPVDPKHPLYERLRALQSQHMPVLEASPDDPRGLPSDASLPTIDMHYTTETMTEVISRSPSVVSLLDWSYSYSGGPHPNLGFASHTRIRSPDGQWRDAQMKDLFGRKGPWYQQIVGAVIKDLTRQGASVYVNDEEKDIRPPSDKLLAVWNAILRTG